MSDEEKEVEESLGAAWRKEINEVPGGESQYEQRLFGEDYAMTIAIEEYADEHAVDVEESPTEPVQ